MSLLLILVAAGVCGFSGLPPMFMGSSSNRGQALAALLSVAGSVVGLGGVTLFLLGDADPAISRPWNIPGGAFTVALDGLSAAFLVPVFLISGAGAVYGLRYWRQSDNPQNGRKLRLFYGLLTAGMGILLIARASVLFLVSWEVMALSAYFLVATDDRQPSVRAAAWTYLVATHLGTMALLALFALMRSVSGSLEWAPIAEASISTWLASAIFLLALFGFGLKAGIMPFHVWLPSAHASAPSHVSGLLSGVMIKMGIYGILRIAGYLPRPPLWWGALLLVLGIASGIIGIASAIGQRDLKRMLAYSSIENIGIIVVGIGLALMGRTLGVREWVTLGLGGALLHVLNHSLFKPLLFFGAGSVIHATHTRDIECLGGLARTMPITFFGFLAGAWAICGLPVFNGFMSELLLYLGLFNAVSFPAPEISLLTTMAAAALAMIGALAAACFVRAAGVIFLGKGRSEAASRASESSASMTGALVLLASLCLFLGLAPLGAEPLVDRALGGFGEGISTPISRAAPLEAAGFLGLAVASLAGLVGGCLWLRSKRRPASADALATWDCGYVDPSSSRLQYTGASMGEILGGLFRWAVSTKENRPRRLEIFPARDSYSCEAQEPLLDRSLQPFCRRWAARCSRLRVLQRGNLQMYLVYILVTLLLLIAWAKVTPGAGP